MRALLPLLVLLVVTPALQAADTDVMPIPNGDFEDGETGWTNGGSPASRAMSKISTEQAASGKASLRVEDASDAEGSSFTSARIPLPASGVYELRGKYLGLSGDGLGIYLRLYDAQGQCLNSDDSHLLGLGGTDQKWRSWQAPVYVPATAKTADIHIHSYGKSLVTGFLDDLQLVRMTAQTGRPWPAQYKLRPDEKARLTAADVVGPDGLVYPNWTRCGVPGGIPTIASVTTIEAHGGKADDGADDAAALQAACDAVGKAGGGAVALGAGTYHLDRPVTIRQNGVIIRGAGRDRTHFIFRYTLPPSGIGFYLLKPGEMIGNDSRIELQARPAGLMKLVILVDETPVGEWNRSTHSGNTFNFAISGRQVLAKTTPGQHTLTGTATYVNGTSIRCALPVRLDAAFVEATPQPSSQAAITFLGQGYAGPRVLLTKDGARGADRVEVQDASGFKPGDCLVIDGPATERWKQLTRNLCPWGTYRRYFVGLKAIVGNTLVLEQPLRLEFPVIDGSFVQKVVPVQRCGVEDFSLEQTEDLWISSVFFNNAWTCWARGIKIRKCGRFPVYAGAAKWCEFRDCIFDDAWFKGGGGTAYAGWEHASDCLMENVETFKLRHAPLVQWAASGCVIRKGVFHESDGQWHSGWTNENLFEQCVIECSPGNGAYGYGMWASPPEDASHGPNGPRNVVYNCDVSSPKSGLWMGGMNENWLILYNRFMVRSGNGVFAKTASFDHIIRGNVFVLQDNKSPMVRLATPDCVGIEIVDNLLFGGNGKFAEGLSEAERLTRNEARALAEAPRPTPAVPSIYEWQLQKK